MKKFFIDDIVACISNYNIVGIPNNNYFANALPIVEANEHSIVWIAKNNANKQALLESTKANFIICDSEINCDNAIAKGKCCIIVDNPKLAFIEIISKLFVSKAKASIHPTAIVHPEANIGHEVSIGPNTYIGKCNIGNNVTLFGNNYLYDNVTIGNNVTINAGTIIGSDGFGYAKNEEGIFEKFPHIGGVLIEDNVEIGANTCIDKGTLGNTIIKKGAKIDNLVHVAHNVVIGENSLVIALAMIGGSTKIGTNVWIAPATALRDGIEIGDNSIVGMGAVITKSIPKGEVWFGNPGKSKNV